MTIIIATIIYPSHHFAVQTSVSRGGGSIPRILAWARWTLSVSLSTADCSSSTRLKPALRRPVWKQTQNNQQSNRPIWKQTQNKHPTFQQTHLKTNTEQTMNSPADPSENKHRTNNEQSNRPVWKQTQNNEQSSRPVWKQTQNKQWTVQQTCLKTNTEQTMNSPEDLSENKHRTTNSPTDPSENKHRTHNSPAVPAENKNRITAKNLNQHYAGLSKNRHRITVQQKL